MYCLATQKHGDLPLPRKKFCINPWYVYVCDRGMVPPIVHFPIFSTARALATSLESVQEVLPCATPKFPIAVHYTRCQYFLKDFKKK